MRTVFTISLFLFSYAICATAKDKKNKHKGLVPEQPDMHYGCLSIVDIFSTRLGWRDPAAVTARVINDCEQSIEVSITLAYFDKQGIQFANDYVFQTVAPHAKYPFIVGPTEDVQQYAFGHGHIVNVTLSAQ